MTLTDFYTRVLRKLKVVPPNGAALSEDLQRVIDVYPQVHAMLLSEGMVEWGVAEAIPDKFALPMIDIVACHLLDDFSVPQEDMAKLKMEGELFGNPPSSAERKLKKLLDPDYVESTGQSLYY